MSLINLKKFACALILTHEDKILLQLRSKNKKHFPDCIGTFGGKIEEGESPGEAMIREIKEELGADIEESEIMSLGCVPDEFNDSPEVTHVYFWHDKQNKITGCYEDYPIYLDCITEAAQYSSVMEYTKWLMKICFDLGLVK